MRTKDKTDKACSLSRGACMSMNIFEYYCNTILAHFTHDLVRTMSLEGAWVTGRRVMMYFHTTEPFFETQFIPPPLW